MTTKPTAKKASSSKSFSTKKPGAKEPAPKAPPARKSSPKAAPVPPAEASRPAGEEQELLEDQLCVAPNCGEPLTPPFLVCEACGTVQPLLDAEPAGERSVEVEPAEEPASDPAWMREPTAAEQIVPTADHAALDQKKVDEAAAGAIEEIAREAPAAPAVEPRTFFLRDDPGPSAEEREAELAGARTRYNRAKNAVKSALANPDRPADLEAAKKEKTAATTALRKLRKDAKKATAKARPAQTVKVSPAFIDDLLQELGKGLQGTESVRVQEVRPGVCSVSFELPTAGMLEILRRAVAAQTPAPEQA